MGDFFWLMEDIAKTTGDKSGLKFKSPKTDDKDAVASVIDDEFRNLGYPSTARLSILGDVGRENAWDRNTIFQGHRDPKNQAYNRGIFSYQGDRQIQQEAHLKKEGVYGRGDDNELRGMVRFADSEMKSRFPDVYNTLRNAKSTAEASKALRKYIKYVPDAPYNTPDPEFETVNNRQWAERARQKGLVKDGGQDFSFLEESVKDVPTQDFSFLVEDAQGGQPTPPTVPTNTFLKPGEPLASDAPPTQDFSFLVETVKQPQTTQPEVPVPAGAIDETTIPHEAPHLDRVSVLAPQTKRAITSVRGQKVPQNAQKPQETPRRDSSLSGITSVPIDNIPAENIDNFLSRQALLDAAKRQGLGGDAVDAFLTSRGGNILQTGTQPYTAEEIASYKNRGVKKIDVSFDKALEEDFRRFATDYTEAKTKDANEKAAQQQLRANIDEKNKGTNGQLSFTDPLTWKMAWDELWKGNWSGTVTEESRQQAIDNAVSEQIKNAGSAQERLKLDEEYKNLSNFDKGMAHVGDITNTIMRSPASFAKTAQWAEDTIEYLHQNDILVPFVTTSELLRAGDWMISKTLGLPESNVKAGALPAIYAQVVESMFPDDKRTANTMAGKIARGTGSAVPFLLGAMITGGSSPAVALMGAGMQVGEMYDTAQKEGLSREKQLLSGALGIPIGASEAWGLKWAKLGELINNRSKGVFLKSFTNWLKETGKDATEEALQEFFQSTASKLTITALKNNGLTFKDVTNAVGDSVEDAAVGGIVGALFGGGVPLAVKAGEKAKAPVTVARTEALLKTEPEPTTVTEEPTPDPVATEPKVEPEKKKVTPKPTEVEKEEVPAILTELEPSEKVEGVVGFRRKKAVDIPVEKGVKTAFKPVDDATKPIVWNKRYSDVDNESQTGQFVGKDGEKYFIKRTFEGNNSNNEIRVYDKQGKEVGRAVFDENTDHVTGFKSHQSIKVEPEYRRRGIATAMLDFAEQQYGKPYKPVDALALSSEMEALAKKRGVGNETNFVTKSQAVKDDEAVAQHKRERNRLMRRQQTANRIFATNPSANNARKLEQADAELEAFNKQNPPLKDLPPIVSVAQKLDAVKELNKQKRETLAEIEDEAKSLEAQGKTQDAKDLRDRITAEYNAKILEAKKGKAPIQEINDVPLTKAEAEILYQDDNGNYITQTKKGAYKIWKSGATHATLAGTVDLKENGLERAKQRLAQLSVSPKAKSETQQVTRTINGKTYVGEVYKRETTGKEFVRYTKINGQEGNTPLNDTWKPVSDPMAMALNASGESSASLEAMNRVASEKAQQLKRVVVDTRSGKEYPLIGVDAVDRQARDYESIEFRGGNRNGEVISQGAKVSRAYSPPMAMVAWHGSPHKFDKFDSSKIGTGEGAQAYGHGLYFAGDEKVAEHYKNTLGRVALEVNGATVPRGDAQRAAVTAWNALDASTRKALERDVPWTNITERQGKYYLAHKSGDGSYIYGGFATKADAQVKLSELRGEQAIIALRHLASNGKWDDTPIANALKNHVKVSTGAKYKVDLKPAEDEYLLWDKPLSEQSKKVQKALSGLTKYDVTQMPIYKELVRVHGKDVADTYISVLQNDLKGAINNFTDTSGGSFYKSIQAIDADKGQAASSYLKSLGIRGIKYLDGTSRGKGEGSYNYVIFDDADVEIEEVMHRVPTKPTPQMEEVVDYDTGELATKAKYSTEGSLVTLGNLEAYGLANQAIQAITGKASHFYGMTLNPSNVAQFREEVGKFIKDAGFSPKERTAFNKFVKAIDTAAKTNPKETVRIVLLPDAIAEESAHEARMQTMASEAVEASQSKDWIDRTVKSPLFKQTNISKRYKGKQIQAIEFVDKLIAKNYDDLGIDPNEHADEIIDIIQDWADDFIATNGEVDWSYYEKLNEINAALTQRISEEKGGDTKDTGKQDAQRDEAQETRSDVGAEAESKPDDGVKIRQYSESLRDAGFGDAPLVPYVPGTDMKKAEETNRIIEASDPMMHDAEKVFYAKTTDPKLKGVLGTALIDHLGSLGEIDRMLKVATDTVEYIGTAAQILQAAKLVSKYDFATGLMMAQKAANKAGRSLTPKEVDTVTKKLTKIAVTVENQASLEFAIDELQAAIEAKDREIADRDKALAEAQEQRALTDKEIANLKKQLKEKKPTTTREKLKERRAEIEAKIRQQFKSQPMAMALSAETDLTDLIDAATMAIFDGKTPAQMTQYLQDLTGNALSKEDIAKIHLAAWDATGYKTKPTTLDELNAEDKQHRIELRNRAKARREHIRAINELKGTEKVSKYTLEVQEYGRDNGYTDGEIAGALLLPKLTGNDAVEQWKKKLADEGFKDVDFKRAYHLRKVANANIKQQQLEDRHAREQYQGELGAFKNDLSRARNASLAARNEFDRYAKKVGRGWVKKGAVAVTETLAATKGLGTWGEISYVLRQGFVPLITDTRIAAKSDWQGVGHGLQGDNVLWQKLAEKAGLEDMAQYLSDHSVSMFIDRIRQHPAFTEAQSNGIRFTQIGDFNIADDHFSVKALEVIPLYKRTEYAYTLPGDLQRLYMYDAWAKIIDGQGLDVIQAKRAKKYAAETINAFTGKGDVKRILASNGAFAKLLNLAFFSPQLLISRFQTVNRLTTGFLTAPKGMKYQMAKKGMRFYAIVGLLAYLTGMVIDPDDDDFGTIKIKFGDRDMQDTRVNILAGLDVPGQLYMRTASGMMKSLVSGEKGYLDDAMTAGMSDFLLDKRQTPRFARSKMSPGASFMYDWYDGYDFIGRPTTLWGSITSRIAPMSWGQVYDAFLYDRYREMVKEGRTADYAVDKALTSEQKWGNAATTLVASFLGTGIVQYPKDDLSQAVQLARQLSPVISKKEREQLRKEGGLRNLLKAQITAPEADKSKVRSEIQEWLQKYPELRRDMAKLQSQANSKTGLLAYYVKDLNADQLKRVREKATDVDEIKVIDQMIKKAEKKK